MKIKKPDLDLSDLTITFINLIKVENGDIVRVANAFGTEPIDIPSSRLVCSIAEFSSSIASSHYQRELFKEGDLVLSSTINCLVTISNVDYELIDDIIKFTGDLYLLYQIMYFTIWNIYRHS